VIAFGNLNLRTIVSKLLSVLVKIALITSEAFILTDPNKISRIKKMRTNNKRHEKISLIFLPGISSTDNSLFVSVFK
jgi:hypothetical protein